MAGRFKKKKENRNYPILYIFSPLRLVF